MWAPNFLKYNRPNSINSVKAVINSLHDLPEGKEYDKLLAKLYDVADGLSDALRQAMIDGLPKSKAFYEEREGTKDKDKDLNIGSVGGGGGGRMRRRGLPRPNRRTMIRNG
jgi:hypothetical protein